jgi:P27 family predicted phage terminase small subunit
MIAIMGRRGPAPKPTAVRLLHGDRKDRINLDEPMPSLGSVECPEWLSADAKSIWTGLAPDLHRQGLLTGWDVEAFANFCDAAARRRRAAAHLEAEGEVVSLPAMDHGRVVGTRVAPNPWAAILVAADTQVQRYAARFGLTPSDRGQLRVDPVGREPGWDLLS